MQRINFIGVSVKKNQFIASSKSIKAEMKTRRSCWSKHFMCRHTCTCTGPCHTCIYCDSLLVTLLKSATHTYMYIST